MSENEAKDIVQHEQSEVNLGSLAMRPEAVVGNATKLANALADVVKERKLYSNIRNKKYVRVEGWNTLGAMLGVLPKERDVEKIENGYRAYVDIVRTSDGKVIGGASSICTRDEKRWKDADPYAIRSMAVTRATGKAFRLGFSWIMKLAGYEPTPAEEMDFVEGEYEEQPTGNGNPPPPPPQQSGGKKSGKEPAPKKTRPLSAGEAKSAILGKVARYEKSNATATAKQKDLIKITWTKLFDDKTQRYAVSDWIGLPTSTTEWVSSEVLAILDWMAFETHEEQDVDGKVKTIHVPSEDALTEAKRMWKQAQLDQGQQEMM